MNKDQGDFVELKKYKELSFRGMVGWLMFVGFTGFYAYLGDALELYIIYFFIGMVVGIVPGIIITKQLRKSLVGNILIFPKGDKYKALFYGVIIGNTVMILMIVIIILSIESPLTFDNLLENLVRSGTKFTGIMLGAMFITLIIQYIWVSQYETKKEGGALTHD